MSTQQIALSTSTALSASAFEALLTTAMKDNMQSAIVALCHLRLEESAIARKIAYADAMRHLQARMPIFEKTKIIRDKNGAERSRYVPHDEVMQKVQPLLNELGFSIMTTTRYSQSEPYMDPKASRMFVIKTVTASSTLLHISGYESAPAEFTAIIDDDAFMSTTQKAGAAATYATNQAELLILGVTTTDVPAYKNRNDERHVARQSGSGSASPDQRQARPTTPPPSSGSAQASNGTGNAVGSAQTEAPSVKTDTPLPNVNPDGSADEKAQQIIYHIFDLPADGFLNRNLRAAKKVAHEHFGDLLPETITAALKPRFRESDEMAKAARSSSRPAAAA